MKNYFAIITIDKYPNRDAGSVRTCSLAKLLIQLGYEPIVIGMGPYTGGKYLEDGNVKYCSLRCKSNNIISRVLGMFAFEIRVFFHLCNLGLDNISGLMFVSGSHILFRVLKIISKKRQIPLLYDCVEWYSPCEFNKGEQDYFYKKNNKLNSQLVDSNVSVISISTYLDDYYKRKQINSIRIPVILDVKKIDYCIEKTSERIKIVYAGMPGKKDHLVEFLTAIQEIKHDIRNRLNVTVVGIGLETYEESYGKLDSDIIGNIVTFLGRKSREETMRIVRMSDFALLLRKSDERYAKAGFPTKVVESMSLGTAMLCNLSSDLDMYLIDKENSILIDECSVKACKSSLRKLLACTDKEIEAMKANARKCAEENFDYSQYVESVQQLIE